MYNYTILCSLDIIIYIRDDEYELVNVVIKSYHRKMLMWVLKKYTLDSIIIRYLTGHYTLLINGKNTN